MSMYGMYIYAICAMIHSVCSRHMEEGGMEVSYIDMNKIVSVMSNSSYYMKIDTKGMEYVVVQFIDDEVVGILSAVVHINNKTIPLKNDIQVDMPNIFYSSNSQLKRVLDGNASECVIEVKIQKRNKMIKKYNILAISSSSSTIDIDYMRPLNLPLIENKPFIFNIKPNTTTDAGININVVNRFANILISVKLSGKSKNGQSIDKIYKSGDLWTNIVHIPSTDIQLFDQPDINIVISRKQTENDLFKFNSQFEWFEIQVSSQTLRLNNKKPSINILKANRWAYYIIKKMKKNTGLITLTVLEGESDLYVKNGSDVYPDLNTYDFVSNSVKDDEITLPKSNQTSEEYETYTVGVFASTNTRYRINYDHNSRMSVVMINEGEVIQKRLIKGNSIVATLNSPFINEELTIGYTGENGAVELFAGYYNELNQSFIDSIPDSGHNIKHESNKVPGRITRVDIPKSDRYGELVFKLISESTQVVTFFAIRKISSVPIRLKGGSSLTDQLDKGRSQQYQVEYDFEITRDEFEISAISGELSISITDKLSFEEDDAPLLFKIKSIGNIATKTLDLRLNRKQGADMGLFRKYLVKIIAIESSMFSLSSRKKSGKYIEILSAKTNTLTYDSEDEKIYYYKISKTEDIKTLKLIFEVKNPFWSETRGNAFSLFESQQQLFDSTQIYYVSEENFGAHDKEVSSRIPADIKKKDSVNDSDKKYLSIEINVMPGYLVIRPSKNDRTSLKFRFDLQLVINNLRNFDPNGRAMVKLSQDLNKISYLMVLPQESVISIIASICYGSRVSLSIKNFNELYELQPTKLAVDEDVLNSTISHRIENLGPARAIYITVTYEGNGTSQESVFSMTSSVSRLDDVLTLKDLFNDFENFKTPNGIGYPVEITQDAWSVDYNIRKIRIPDMFYRKYPEVKTIEVTYLVYLMKTTPKIFEADNICDIEVFRRSDGPRDYHWVKTMENIVNREEVSQYDKIPSHILKGYYPQNESAPYKGLLQIVVRLRQEQFDEVSKDAGFMFKIPFTIESRPRPPYIYYIGYITLIGVIVAVLLILLKYWKNSAGSSAQKGQKYSRSNATDTSNLEMI